MLALLADALLLPDVPVLPGSPALPDALPLPDVPTAPDSVPALADAALPSLPRTCASCCCTAVYLSCQLLSAVTSALNLLMISITPVRASPCSCPASGSFVRSDSACLACTSSWRAAASSRPCVAEDACDDEDAEDEGSC